MADDSVLRIVFDSAGDVGSPGAGAPGGLVGSAAARGSRASGGYDPIAEAGAMLDRERKRATTQEYYNLAKFGRIEGDLPTVKAARTQQEKAYEQKQLEAQMERQRRAELTPRILATQQIAGVASQAGIPGAQQIGSLITASMIGGPLAMTTAVASAAITAVKAIDAKVMEVAKDAGQYSPQVAMAEAQAEVRRIQNDLRRAPELGPALGKLVDAESKLDEQIRDLFTSPEWIELKTVLVDLLTTLVEALNWWKGRPAAVIGAAGDFAIAASEGAKKIPFLEALVDKIVAVDVGQPGRRRGEGFDGAAGGGDF